MTTKVRSRMISGAAVNVLDFGAKGDGVSDDAPAFQAALNKGKILLIPEGTYILKERLTLDGVDVNIEGHGKNTIVIADHNNTALLSVQNASVHIKGVYFKGKNILNQEGVRCDSCTDSSIVNCFFNDFGATHSGLQTASPIQFRSSRGIRIQNNRFYDNMRATGSSDIALSYAVRDTIVTGNYSTSNMDQFINLAAVSYSGDYRDTEHHTISNNVGIRPDGGTSSRHGCLASYSSMNSYVTISNNVFVGFNWTGVYVQASNEEPGREGGGVTISNNVIRYCGGDDGGADGSLSASIWVGGKAGATVSGNLITDTGYRPNGTARDFKIPAIFLLTVATNVAITGNTLKKGTKTGIAMGSTTGTDLTKNVTINGNIIAEFDSNPISISGVSGEQWNDVVIDGNVLSHTSKSVEADSRCINFGPSGAIQAVGTVKISDNIFKSDKTNTYSTGVYIRNNTIKADISGNSFENLKVGVETGAYEEIIGFVSTVSDNIFRDCDKMYKALLNGDLLLLHKGNLITGSTPRSTSTRVYEVVSNDSNLTIRGKQAPSSTRFTTGDIFLFDDPVTSGFLGARFNGTAWANFGTIS